MSGIINGNNNQVTINVFDQIPPENIATIDDGGLVGNVNTKEQVQAKFDEFSEEINNDIDERIAEIQEMVESDFKGSISPSDPTPTVDGTYKPTISSKDNIGVDPVNYGTIYTNAGNLRAKEGYSTYFYKNGSVWTKSEDKLPKLEVAATFDPTNDTDAQGAKQIKEYFEFKDIDFSASIDLTRNSKAKYIALPSGLTTFSLAAGAKMGYVLYAKLTGGAVVFPSNFVNSGTTVYDASKTNILTFWMEYNDVMYDIRSKDLEPVLVNGVLSYYNFNGKPANTLLTAITPDTGISLMGGTGDYRINSSGIYLERTVAVTSNNNAIGLNTIGLNDYKIKIYMNCASAAYFSFGCISVTDFTNHIGILPSQNKIIAVSPSHPTGEVISTPTGIPTSTIVLWEFRKIGSVVEIYVNDIYRGSYNNPNTGTFFSFIQNSVGDRIQSFKIEEL
jgi:hypothetical protein